MEKTLIDSQSETVANSIAVLPFVNMSNDPEQEYIGEGIAEEILISLSNLNDLKVAARSSSFQFSTKLAGLRDIGEKLGVSTVLEGSVRKQGERLRITVQLVNVEDGFHIWSEKYDRKMGDIFAIQDEIAINVTEKLKATFQDVSNTSDEIKSISRTHTKSTEAYDLYLKGRFHMNRRGPSIYSAIKYFEESFTADPTYTPAFAGYADSNLLCALYGLLPPLETMEKAKNSAEMAIQLDPELCEPWCSLGFFYACARWDWQESEKSFLKAIELNPRYAQAHFWYGLVLLAWVKGDYDKAEKHGLLAIKAEPLSSICYATYGGILHAAGKYELALQACRAGLELDPNSFLCRVYEGQSLLSLKRYDEAAAACEQGMSISNRHSFALNGLIRTYVKAGKLNKASVLMYELRERNQVKPTANTITGLSLSYMDIDGAFELLEKAFRQHEPFLLTIRCENWLSEIVREDRRFKSLLQRIGFPNA